MPLISRRRFGPEPLYLEGWRMSALAWYLFLERCAVGAEGAVLDDWTDLMDLAWWELSPAEIATLDKGGR